MLHRFKELKRYTIQATDGEIGVVDDLFFDDSSLMVRYLVVDTNDWLPGGKVLVPPSELGKPKPGEEVFPVDLTSEQVRKQPPIAFDRPISRQVETDLHKHFGWQPYWVRGPFEGPVPGLFSEQSEGDTESKRSTSAVASEHADPNLRSCDEVVGYRIMAEDGEVGNIDDLAVDPDNWRIRHMIVESGNWLKNRKVLLAMDWADKISWSQSLINVGLTRDAIKDSPEYNPEEPIERQYEEELYDYYGRKKYWIDKEK